MPELRLFWGLNTAGQSMFPVGAARARAQAHQHGVKPAVSILHRRASAQRRDPSPDRDLVWEVLQLPLYTIWAEGSLGEQVFAVAHCTAGDLLIAVASLVLALLLFGRRQWPAVEFVRVALVAILLGVAYTAFSEWLNVSVRRNWAYSAWMPVLAIGPVRIGLSPLIQWLVVPTAAFAIVRRPP